MPKVIRRGVVKCMLPDCNEYFWVKGFCKSHYRKLFENKARYRKVKSDPVLSQKAKQASSNYKNSERYKLIRKDHDRKYAIENRDRILEYKRRWNETKRFGTTRDNVLFRDNHRCYLDKNHTENLVVHHRNGLGRCTETPDNNPDNLITLCKSCHMKIHNPAYLKKI